MQIFLTSDQHFRHAKIIEYCNRPFANVDEMDEAMIERWNLVVGTHDHVYHLGDFTLGDEDQAANYFRRLNGTVLILYNPWHHDHRWIKKRPHLWTASGDVQYLQPLESMIFHIPNKQWITLCHYPMQEWDRKFHGAWHLHGHTHKAHVGKGLSLNVGVDCWDYYPVSLDQIAVDMRELERKLNL